MGNRMSRNLEQVASTLTFAYTFPSVNVTFIDYAPGCFASCRFSGDDNRVTALIATRPTKRSDKHRFALPYPSVRSESFPLRMFLWRMMGKDGANSQQSTLEETKRW